MTPRSTRIAVLCVFGAALAFELAGALAFSKGRARMFKDEADLDIYLERTSWVPAGTLPYRDVFQEYPPIGAYYLALPRLFTNDARRYADASYVLGAGLLAGIFFVLQRHLPSDRLGHALVLCAPCVLFYSLNRYDALPAILFLATMISFTQGRERLSALLFGLTCGAKWYPIAAAPVFFVLSRGRWRWAAWAAASTAVSCLHPLLYAPAAKVWATYEFHLTRGANRGSLYDVLSTVFPRVVHADGPLQSLLLPLQFVPGLLAAGLAWRRRLTADPRTVACLTFASVAGFTFFATFHSPQWQVWLAPLCALAVSKPLTRSFVTADILLYSAIPLVWNLLGENSRVMPVFTALYLAFLGFAVVQALQSAALAPLTDAPAET